MGNHRMFSKRVVDSGRFLMLPAKARLLYYDLGMSADDDGVAEAFTVMRTTGATRKELRLLTEAGYVLPLEGEHIVYIRDWKENNIIRKDRYHPSIHAELLKRHGLSPGVVRPVDEMEPEDKVSQGNSIKENEIKENRMLPVIMQAQAQARARDGHPSIEEVRSYMRLVQEQEMLTHGTDIAAEAFYRHFTAAGWRRLGVPLTDWKTEAKLWAIRGG